jgi:hypothetical protein
MHKAAVLLLEHFITCSYQALCGMHAAILALHHVHIRHMHMHAA